MGRLRPFVAALVVVIVTIGSQGVLATIEGSAVKPVNRTVGSTAEPLARAETVARGSTTRIDRLSPADVEVTVSPGSDLLVELSVSDPAWNRSDRWWDHAQVRWFVDGERRSSGYPSVSINPHLTLDNVSSGTHMITAIVSGEDGRGTLGTVAWIVHVEDGANEPPGVERVDPEGERIEVDEGGEVRDFTLAANDPEGGLHRVLWFAGMCDDPLGSTAVTGREDEATLTYRAGDCGVVGGWAVDERGVMNPGGLDGLTGWEVATADDGASGDGNGTDDGADDGGNEGASGTWHTLAVDGQGTSSRTDYSFAVTGTLEADGGLGGGDSMDGSSAEGFVRAGRDRYRFTGELQGPELTGGDGVVSVDGERVNESGDEEWHTIAIDGRTSDGRSDYTFAVSGDLEPKAGIGSGDSIDGSTAEGFVDGGRDAYRFTGELTTLDLDGNATASVDGEETDATA